MPGYNKKDLDELETVSKRCAKRIANSVTEKVNRNLKTKNIKV